MASIHKFLQAMDSNKPTKKLGSSMSRTKRPAKPASKPVGNYQLFLLRKNPDSDSSKKEWCPSGEPIPAMSRKLAVAQGQFRKRFKRGFWKVRAVPFDG